MTNVFFVEFMLTRSCNFTCNHCDVYDRNGKTKVDIEFLKYVLELCPDDLMVEMTGGEIGLITNIDEVYRVIQSHEKVKYIQVMSNGLMRQRGTTWLKDVYRYNEHLISGRSKSKTVL